MRKLFEKKLSMRPGNGAECCAQVGVHLEQAMFLAVGFVLLSLNGAFGQNPDSLRLEQVIQDVIKNNNRIAAAKYMEDAARAKVGPAGAWDDPMLMLGVTNVPTSWDLDEDPMTMKMVGISQNIPYSGQKGLQSKAAQAEASVAQQERYGMEVDLAMAARWEYADLYYRTKSLSDLGAQFELLNDVVATSKAKLTANQAGQDEVLGAMTELWRLQAEILEAEHMVDESRYNLNILRGIDVNSGVPPLAAPDELELPMTPDSLLGQAKSNYPPLQKLLRESEAYGYSSRAARRMSWPMLGLSANYGFRSGYDIGLHGNVEGERSDMISVQATLSLPLFAGRQQRNMAAAMDAMRRSVDAEVAQKWREVEARIRLLHITAIHLKETVALYHDRIVPADEDAYQSALAGYSANQVPYTNLLMLASSIYRDHLALNQYSNELSRTMAEINSYTIDPRSLSLVEKE